jgi:tetratricopeptide (TPR) repeat protein
MKKRIIYILFFTITCNLFAGNSYSLLKKANALFLEKKYKEAIDVYKEINQKYDITEAQVNLARCNYFLQNYSVAEDQYKKIIDFPNINLDVYKEYAIILEKKDKKAEAQIWNIKYQDEIKKQKNFYASIPSKEVVLTKDLALIESKKDTLVENKVKTPKPPKVDSVKIKNQTIVVDKKPSKEVLVENKVKTPKPPKVDSVKIKNQTAQVDKKPSKEVLVENKVKAPKPPKVDSVKIKNQTVIVDKKPSKEVLVENKVKAPKPPKVDSLKIKNQTVAVDKNPSKDVLVENKVKAPKPPKVDSVKIKNQTVAVDKKPSKEVLVENKVKAPKPPKVDSLKNKNQTVTVDKKPSKEVLVENKVKAPKPPKDTSVVKSKKSKVNDLVFKINLATFLKDPGLKYFKDISGYGQITFIKVDKTTIYYLGDFKTYDEANKMIKKLDETFYEESFVVPFYKGNIISIEEAINIQTKP